MFQNHILFIEYRQLDILQKPQSHNIKKESIFFSLKSATPTAWPWLMISHHHLHRCPCQKCDTIFCSLHSTHLVSSFTSFTLPCSSFLGAFTHMVPSAWSTVFLHFNYISSLQPSGLEEKSFFPKGFLRPPYLFYGLLLSTP